MIGNVISGAVLFALSAVYYLTAAKMPKSILDTTVNSAAFPKLLGIAGMLFSAALIAQSLLARRQAPADGIPPARDEETAAEKWRPHLRALGLLVITCLFIVALELVGYPVAVAGLILAVSVYQGYPLSWLSVAVAVAGGLAFWLFFMVFLGIHLPLGLWSRLGALVPFLPLA